MDPFLSEIRAFPFDFAPRGWAVCDGAELPVAQNQALHALLGSAFGGNATAFNLPDLRGRVPVHFGAGLSLGQQAGANGALQLTGGGDMQQAWLSLCYCIAVRGIFPAR